MDWKDKVDNLREALWVAALISVPLTTILTFIFFGIWAVYGDPLIEKAREELGIRENYELTMRALGEDKVLRQPEGLSFVQEPVYSGEDILVNLVIERTDWGDECLFNGGSTVFIQPNGITISGGSLPVIKQISTDSTRFQLQVDSPNLHNYRFRDDREERWALFFLFDYTCYGQKITEESRPLPFILREK